VAVEPLPETPSPAEEEHDDDGAIEQYMIGLLERVRGGTAAVDRGPEAGRPGKAAQPAAAPAAPSPTPSPAPPSPSPAASRPPEAIRERTAAETRPAESVGTMSAMREVARLNAQIAIEEHAIKRLILAARGRLLTATVSMAATFAVLRNAHFSPHALGTVALLGTFIAVVFGAQYLQITNDLSRRLALAGKGQAEPGDAAPSPRADAS
jgi:hypothetical protein